MELGQPHLVRVLNDEGIGVGDVDAGLDDGGADQHVHLPLAHPGHDLVQFLLGHLPVGDGDAGVLPQHPLNPGRGAGDGLHTVVKVVDLSPPLQLTAHGVGQDRPVVLQHIGLDRPTVGGRLLQGAHVPDARERHVQRARDGRGRQREHVHLLGELLQLLLVGHAEALLLVHHQQPQILELHVLLEEPVGADEQVHAPLPYPAQSLLHLRAGAEAGHHVYLHRVLGKPLLCGEEMLPRQDGGWHQNSGLLAVQDALHNGPEGHLGLAVAHVAAEQPVHGPGQLHVLFDLGNAAQLVVGLAVLKLLLKLLHPGRVRGKGEARLPLPLGIELDESLGQVGHRPAGLGLGLLPVGPPQLGELPRLVCILAAADVLAHQIELCGGHIEGVRPGVGNFHIVLLDAVHRHLHHALVPADAVVLMDHQIPHGEVGVGPQLLPVRDGLVFFLLSRGGLPLGEHGKFSPRVLRPGGEPPHRDDRLAGRRQVVEGKVHRRPELLLPQQGLQVQRPLLAGHQHHRGKALVHIVAQIRDRRLQAGAVAGELLCQDVNEGPGPPGVAGPHEGVQIGHRPLLQHPAELLKAPGKDGQLPRQGAALHQDLGVLSELPGVIFRTLRHPGTLGEEDGRVLREVVRRRGELGVDEGQVAVHGRKGHVLLQPLPVLLQGLQELGVVPPALFYPGNEAVHPFQQAGEAPGRKLGQHLGGGQNLSLPDVVRPPLGGHVEEAHGVHLVAEELHPDGRALRGGEEVQNAAPQSELAHALHLVAPGVPRGCQGLGQLV